MSSSSMKLIYNSKSITLDRVLKTMDELYTKVKELFHPKFECEFSYIDTENDRIMVTNEEEYKDMLEMFNNSNLDVIMKIEQLDNSKVYQPDILKNTTELNYKNIKILKKNENIELIKRQDHESPIKNLKTINEENDELDKKNSNSKEEIFEKQQFLGRNLTNSEIKTEEIEQFKQIKIPEKENQNEKEQKSIDFKSSPVLSSQFSVEEIEQKINPNNENFPKSLSDKLKQMFEKVYLPLIINEIKIFQNPVFDLEKNQKLISNSEKYVQTIDINTEINELLMSGENENEKLEIGIQTSEIKIENSKLLEKPKNNEEIHLYECNSCKNTPIIGFLYKCVDCKDFYLCSFCEDNNEHLHNMLKIKKSEGNIFESSNNIQNVNESPQFSQNFNIEFIKKPSCKPKEILTIDDEFEVKTMIENKGKKCPNTGIFIRIKPGMYITGKPVEIEKLNPGQKKQIKIRIKTPKAKGKYQCALELGEILVNKNKFLNNLNLGKRNNNFQ